MTGILAIHTNIADNLSFFSVKDSLSSEKKKNSLVGIFPAL